METQAMLVVLIVIGGAAGGLASYLLNSASAPDDSTKSNQLSWYSYMFVGIVAAVVVPLFLKLAQSALISSILKPEKTGLDDYENLLVFTGFCILAGFSSRRFMESVSDRLYAMMKQTRADVVDAKKQASDAKITAEELEENMPLPSPRTMKTTAAITKADAVELPSLTPSEIDLLKTLDDPRFSRRTLMGIAKDSEMPPDTARDMLKKLKSNHLVTEFTSERTNRVLYEITERGLKAMKP